MSAFYDLASVVLVPSGYKSGKIYAQKPLTTDGQLTFTRASTATRVNASGLIESVASGVPRLDYTNSSCPKLLLEPQRTNLAFYSEEFNTSPWSTLGTITITANAINSPSGTLTADLILGADALSSVNQIISGTTGLVYTNSFYIKNNNSTESRLTIRKTITDCQSGGYFVLNVYKQEDIYFMYKNMYKNASYFLKKSIYYQPSLNYLYLLMKS
jgi:hypothetical protein